MVPEVKSHANGSVSLEVKGEYMFEVNKQSYFTGWIEICYALLSTKLVYWNFIDLCGMPPYLIHKSPSEVCTLSKHSFHSIWEVGIFQQRSRIRWCLLANYQKYSRGMSFTPWNIHISIYMFSTFRIYPKYTRKVSSHSHIKLFWCITNIKWQYKSKEKYSTHSLPFWHISYIPSLCINLGMLVLR